MAKGYVAQSGKDRVYYLGNKVLELSGSRMRHFNLADKAIAPLRELNNRTGETVHLAVLQGDQLVTIAVLDSHHAVRVVSSPNGKGNALHATATGKAILAWLPQTECDRLLERAGMSVFTEMTITDPKMLVEELRHVRRNGFAIDREEYQPGVICVGAAIRDLTGAVIGSFSCSLPTMRADEKELQSIETEVKETAEIISANLGGTVAQETETQLKPSKA